MRGRWFSANRNLAGKTTHFDGMTAQGTIQQSAPKSFPTFPTAVPQRKKSMKNADSERSFRQRPPGIFAGA